MTYGQIVFTLFVLMVAYYAFLIVMDIRKIKAAVAAEQENHTEEDIDISDEAQSFQPKKVVREEQKKEEEKKEEATSTGTSEATSSQPEQVSDDTSEENDSSQQDESENEVPDKTQQEGKDNPDDEVESGVTAETAGTDESTSMNAAVVGEFEEAVSEESLETEADSESQEPESLESDEESSEEKNEDKPSASTNEPMGNEQTISVAQPLHSPNYREPIMTDGILVDDIFKAIDQLAETGECDLGTIIYHCESMRYAG